MKKQIIAIVACLALTTTSAFAKSCAKTPVKTAKPAVQAAQKAPCNVKQKMEDKCKQDKEEFYNKLGLTKEQQAKADALEQKNQSEMDSLLAKLFTEKAKFHELKAQKACPAKLDEQKAKVKEAAKAMKTQMEKSKKEFEAILTDCQLKKLKALKEEKKAEMDKCKCKGKCHCKGHHGPDEDDIAPFCPEPEPANKPQTCPCEK